ncbi:unnamed protein product [Prorocentrum cordatum]|uniref:Uncharacterized protein n=1 Tax=Prorocentrum cordatum TaxID=2364126 RepID=A0ABN9SRN7_9DINO|nr:unnamed protein product [Polarella glacialis]
MLFDYAARERTRPSYSKLLAQLLASQRRVSATLVDLLQSQVPYDLRHVVWIRAALELVNEGLSAAPEERVVAFERNGFTDLLLLNRPVDAPGAMSPAISNPSANLNGNTLSGHCMSTTRRVPGNEQRPHARGALDRAMPLDQQRVIRFAHRFRSLLQNLHVLCPRSPGAWALAHVAADHEQEVQLELRVRGERVLELRGRGFKRILADTFGHQARRRIPGPRRPVLFAQSYMLVRLAP